MSTNILQFTIKLQDMLSGKMGQMARGAKVAFDGMETSHRKFRDGFRQTTSSINSLDGALQKLRNSRNGLDLGTTAGMRQLRIYNSEINRLEANLNRLNRINGSRIKTWGKDALNQMPGAGLLSNPLVMAGAGVGFAARAAMQADKTRTSMRVMAGDSAGEKLYGDLTNYARDTIFGTELHENAQTMMGFGIGSEKVLGYTKMLGDVSMGDKNKLGSLTLAFSQIQAAGKLTGQDLLQLINAGFNPLGVMAEKTGKSIGELKKMMESGAISADMVTAAFENATGPGGRFYNMTNKIANTPFGKLEALKGQLEGIAVKLGTSLLPPLSAVLGLIAKFADFVMNNGRDIATVLGIVGGALFLTNLNAAGAAIGFRAAAIGMNFMNSALVRFTMMALTNPFVLLAMGVAGLVMYLRYANKELTPLQEAQKSLAGAQADAAKTAEAEKIRLSELLKVATDGEQPLSRRKDAYDRLTKSMGEHSKALKFDADLAVSGRGAIEAYTASLFKQAEAAAKKDVYQKAYKEYIDSKYSDASENKPGAIASNIMNMSSFGGAVGDVVGGWGRGGGPGLMEAWNYRNDKAVGAYGNRVKNNKTNAAYSKAEQLKALLGPDIVSAAMLEEGGANDPFASLKGTGTGTGSGSGGGKSLGESITGGGPRVININGVKFADTIQIHGGGGKTAFENAEEQMSEMFLRVLNSGARMAT